MSPASKDYEKKILKKEFAHGNNPIMAWMIACTEVKTDPAGNIKPVKPDRKKTGKRIDGVVADIMATWRATISENDISAYEHGEVVAI
jgi:phage terminase large subunit-like protein